MEEKKVLLSVKDLYVKFRVRGRVLTAIRVFPWIFMRMNPLPSWGNPAVEKAC